MSRSSEDDLTLRERICSLEVRMKHIEQGVGKLSDIEEKIDAMTNILSQGKGAAKLLQIMFYVVGPLVAAGYWIKDHLK